MKEECGVIVVYSILRRCSGMCVCCMEGRCFLCTRIIFSWVAMEIPLRDSTLGSAVIIADELHDGQIRVGVLHLRAYGASAADAAATPFIEVVAKGTDTPLGQPHPSRNRRGSQHLRHIGRVVLILP